MRHPCSPFRSDPTVVGYLSVVPGAPQPADRGGLLGVEQHEQPGEAMLRRKGVVVEQSSGLFPASLGVENAGWAGPGGGGEIEAGQFLLLGPSDEGSRAAALAAGGGGHPAVEVELGAGGKAELAGSEPVQEPCGGVDVATGEGGLVGGGVGVAGSLAHPSG